MKTVTAFDAHMMAIALRMAERGLGQTAPNPSVGAVIADPETGELISRAVTAPGGRPHGERIAIQLAGGGTGPKAAGSNEAKAAQAYVELAAAHREVATAVFDEHLASVGNYEFVANSRARGATLYVTLEPCSHTGQTTPCADAIIAVGIKRVVCAIEDPDPRVGGRGLDRLRAAGIEVVRGIGADRARWLTRGHIVRVTERRPFVTLKIAVGHNGDVPQGANGTANFVTGAAARAHGHLLRAQADAIMAGAGTVRADNPQLTCRLPGLEARSPVRAVLGGTRRLLDTSKTRPRFAFASREDLNPIRSSGVESVIVPEVGGKLWLPAVMESLVSHGITRLLVEGGPTVWRSFADASLLDEVVLYMAPDAVHGPADEARARNALQHLLGAVDLTLTEARHLAPDTMWRFRRQTAKPDREKDVSPCLPV